MASSQERWGKHHKAIKKQTDGLKSMRFSQAICLKMGQLWNARLNLSASKGRREKTLTEYDKDLAKILALYREVLVSLIAQLDHTDDRVRELEKMANAQGEHALRNLNVKSVGREAGKALGLS